jgi:hypothetical protein
MDELLVLEAMRQIDRMLIKCKGRDLILSNEVVDDLLDLRGVLSMSASAKGEG